MNPSEIVERLQKELPDFKRVLEQSITARAEALEKLEFQHEQELAGIIELDTLAARQEREYDETSDEIDLDNEENRLNAETAEVAAQFAENLSVAEVNYLVNLVQGVEVPDPTPPGT